MSTDVKVKGEMTIPSDAQQQLLDHIKNYELDHIQPLVDLVRKPKTGILVFDLSLHLSNAEAFEFSEWIDELMEIALTGQLNYWAENFEESTYVLLEAGGKETVIQGSFPS